MLNTARFCFASQHAWICSLLRQAKAQPLLDTINEFGKAPLKSVLDDKQQWAVDRLMEVRA